MLLVEKPGDSVIKKILVIDDDKLVLGSIKKQLKNKNLTIQLIDDPIQAFEEISKNQYDLILCDIRMKSISGLDVLKRIKLKYPDIPVIIITGYIDDKIMENAVNLGSSDFLIKPITKKVLLNSISNIFFRLYLCPGSWY